LQYGDSFLELLRLVMIRHVILPRAKQLAEGNKAAQGAEEEDGGEGEGEGEGAKEGLELVEAPQPQEFLDVPIEELELR
jgi:hypothetical protein